MLKDCVGEVKEKESRKTSRFEVSTETRKVLPLTEMVLLAVGQT